MRLIALISATIFLAPALLFSQDNTNDCEGWDFHILSAYISANDQCNGNILHLDVNIDMADSDNEVFYVYVQMDFEYLLGDWAVYPGLNELEIPTSAQEGELLITVATNSSPPNCSDFQTVDVSGGSNTNGLTDDWANIANTTNASCGVLSDGTVTFYNPVGNFQIFDNSDIVPNPGQIQHTQMPNNTLVYSGFPPGDYCVTFYNTDQWGCGLADEECFTIGSDGNGTFELDSYEGNAPQCGYWQDEPSASWLTLQYPNSVGEIGGFEGVATNTATGEIFDMTLQHVYEDEGYTIMSGFDLGNYCIELNDTESGCSTSFCLDIPEPVDPGPEYQIVIVEGVDIDDENASVVIELISGVSEYEWIYFPALTMQYHTGDTIPGLAAGIHEFHACGYIGCCYDTEFEIPTYGGILGCIDPLSCSYESGATVDDGSCVYYENCDNSCPGWQFTASSEYSTDDCNNPVLDVNLNISGSDAEDDLFYVTILFDSDVHVTTFEASAGDHSFMLTDIVWSGALSITVSTNDSSPSCSNNLIIPVEGVNQDLSNIDLVDFSLTTNATCGKMHDGEVLFSNSTNEDPILYDDVQISPNPGEVTYNPIAGGLLSISGFPVGDYCITFFVDSGEECMLTDQECFTIGAEASGEFTIDEYTVNAPNCDNSAANEWGGGYFNMYFPEAMSTVMDFDVIITDNNNGETWQPEFFNLNDQYNYGWFGYLSLGDYCFEFSDAESGCNSTLCVDINTSQNPAPEYSVVILEGPDENDENAAVSIELVSGNPSLWGEIEWGFEYYNLPAIISETYLGEGVYYFNTYPSPCAYQYEVVVPPYDSGVLGCTDPLSCTYDPEATLDNGSCLYYGDCDDNCVGWEISVESEYSTDACNEPIINLDLELSGTDGEDELFYLTIEFDSDIHEESIELTAGAHSFTLTDILWTGVLTVTVSTDNVAPNCSNSLIIPVSDEFDDLSNIELVDFVATTNATCGNMHNGEVLFTSSENGTPIYYDDVQISPYPGEVDFNPVSGGMLLISGFPVGDYCVTFFIDSGEECLSVDQECFTIGVEASGEFVIEEHYINAPDCDNSAANQWSGGYFNMYFPETMVGVTDFEVSITDNESGESWQPDFFDTNDDTNYGWFGWLALGDYCFEFTDAASGCNSTLCVDIDTSDYPAPEYDIEIIDGPDENGENAVVSIELTSGSSGMWSDIDYYGYSYTVPVEFSNPYLVSGEHFFISMGGQCSYQYDFVVPEYIDPEGCIDPLACNYDPDASIDNGSCNYYENCGDLSGDGIINITDLLSFLGQMGCVGNSEQCPGDFNQDGIANLSDLLILLGLF